MRHLVTAAMEAEQAKHAAAMMERDKERLVRTMTIPTNSKAVQRALRALELPICLFGEGPADRSDRLRLALATMQVEGLMPPDFMMYLGQEEENETAARVGPPKNTKVIETQGSDALLEARRRIAAFSIERAHHRLEAQLRFRKELLSGQDSRNAAFGSVASKWKQYQSTLSEVGDKRPLSCCSIASHTDMFATGSWSGTAKLWSNEGDLLNTLSVSEHRLTDALFHPQTDRIAFAAADGSIALYSSTDPSLKAVVDAHRIRAARLAWHPMGDHLVSSGFDYCWKLWDVETQTNLITQQGHGRGVYAVACHHDGSLVVSGDLGGVASVWDLRSGQRILDLKGHARAVLASAFSRDGYRLVTGGGDNAAILWDLRTRKQQYTFAGHMSLVSHAQFTTWSWPSAPIHQFACDGEGEVLLTSSYDHTLKVWSMRDLKLLHTLKSHEDKVMQFDVSATNLISASYDRTWKSWSPLQ